MLACCVVSKLLVTWGLCKSTKKKKIKNWGFGLYAKKLCFNDSFTLN